MTIKELKNLAKKFSSQNKDWHFHILTPECRLNDSKKYALILENTTDGDDFVVYSEEPYMGIGQELVKLLHGNDVVRNEKEAKVVPPSSKVSKLLKTAKELSEKGVFWHHHMLFPKCKYNKYGSKWVIIFEDKEKGEIIESVTDDEPKGDLQHIEGLFYSQNKS